MFISFFTGKVMLFYGISLIMKEKSNASALVLPTRLSSTGLWTCFHWPVYMFLLASGRISIGQWKHVHCQVNDASSPVGQRVLTWGRRVLASALPTWGSRPQVGNTYYSLSCICLSRHRALTSKCRRGDASPPGEDASPLAEEYDNPSHLLVIY